MSRRVGVALVASLIVFTLLLVALALRKPAPPPTPGAPAGLGSLAVVGDRMWRWVGPAECTPATDKVPLERFSEGRWQPVNVPLVNVTSISFANAIEGIAVGTTSNCALGVVVTRDGGKTWWLRSGSPPLLDGVLLDNTLWGVLRGTHTGQTLVDRYIQTGTRIRPGPAIDTSPCDATDGVPTQVAAYTPDFALQLCQQDVSDGRLLARTINGGVSWDRLTDNRPMTGLDGDGTFTRLEVAGDASVWALFEGGECPEGQLRSSTNGGSTFQRLPCPADNYPLATVFDFAFSSPTQGVLLGLDTSDQPVLLTTSDAGATWKPSISE